MSSYYDDSIKSIQESLARAMEPMRKTLSLYSASLVSTKSFEASINKMMEPYQRFGEQFARSLSFPATESMQKMAKEIASTINTYPNTVFLIDSLTEYLNTIAQPIFSSDFAAALERLGKYSFPDDLGGFDDPDTPDSDYVTVDESAVKEIDISETITFSVGNCRVKIKTGDFIALIFGIITALIAILTLVGQSDSAKSQDQINQVQLQFMQSQNQILSDLLQSVDASFSTQADAIEDLKEAVQEQHSQISQLKESVDLCQESIDKMTESENTESES